MYHQFSEWPSSPDLEPKTLLLGCVLCSCNLTEMNSSDFIYILQAWLSKKQKNLYQKLNAVQFLRIVISVPSLSFHKQFLSLLHSVFVLSFQVTKAIFTGTRTQNFFRCFGLCCYNLFVEINSFSLGAFLLLCLVSELQKSYTPRFEPRIVLWGCNLWSCNLTRTNKFGLGAVLPLCLVSKLQEPPSPDLTSKILFQSFDP
jgi:hypothetical protein